MSTMLIIVSIILVAILFVYLICVFVSRLIFNDQDPDMYWYDNYSVIECPHLKCTIRVVDSVATCEVTHTICDDCGEVINEHIDC